MKRELVIQLTRFGDLIQTKRLIKSLQAEGSEVHLMIDRSLGELASLVYPNVAVHPIISHGTAVGRNEIWRVMLENRKVFDELVTIGFDGVYNLNFSPMNHAVSALFDPDKVRGYRLKNGQELRDPWPDLAFRFSADRRCGINLVDFWAAFADTMISPAKVNPVPEQKGGGIGVVLAGRNSRRSLPVSTLAPLVSAARTSVESSRIILLGSSSEWESGEKLISYLPPSIAADVQNLAGKTGWADLVDVVSGFDRVLSPDTGTMHLAAHLGIPVTAFFLSSAWCTETGPYGEGHKVIQAATDCAPCMESEPCPYEIQCLQSFKSQQAARFSATGKPEHVPEEVILFESGFDALGVDYTPLHGTDHALERRKKLREFLACHLGILDIGEYGPFPEMAEKYYRDKDWITFSGKL